MCAVVGKRDKGILLIFDVLLLLLELSHFNALLKENETLIFSVIVLIKS